LVKKANSSWKMYVDYWALNKETIKDKFLVTIMEKFLDEFYGS
jgi:hypothetical protein